MKYLSILSLCGAIACAGGGDVYAKNDLNKVLSGFGMKGKRDQNAGDSSGSHLSEAKKNEIRLINSFLERLRTIKKQIEKEEKELAEAKERLLLE